MVASARVATTRDPRLVSKAVGSRKRLQGLEIAEQLQSWWQCLPRPRVPECLGLDEHERLFSKASRVSWHLFARTQRGAPPKEWVTAQTWQVILDARELRRNKLKGLTDLRGTGPPQAFASAEETPCVVAARCGSHQLL